MARLRRDTQDSTTPAQRPLRVVASGTLFLTHSLLLPTYPEPSSVVRAQAVNTTRGGSASTCLSMLAQFPAVDAMLVAPLGGNEEGKMILRDLEKERVSTRYCKVWEDVGVPSAWVLHADDKDTRTIINNNPLPDITHEEFVSLLGPLLAPENYAYLSNNPSGSSQGLNAPGAPSTATLAAHNLNALQPNLISSPHPPQGARIPAFNSPAPFDWLHFEGRSVKTTLSNMMGLDGLARERKWRSHCVFSVDVGRRARQGIEALIPHADVLFLNKHYARAHSPQYAASPRAFLLSLTALVPPHSLLVAHWGEEGAAVLSVPTKEYFQSSGWVATDISAPDVDRGRGRYGNSEFDERAEVEVQSVRTGSDFFAGLESSDTSMYTAGMGSGGSMSLSTHLSPVTPPPPAKRGRGRSKSAVRRKGGKHKEHEDDSSDSDGTQIAGNGRTSGNVGISIGAASAPKVVDEVGAQDAFVAGMIYALSRRMLPGEPYTPSAVRHEGGVAGADPWAEGDQGKWRWRLEECLRFATELSGRKARRKGWDGLADEMARAGWFD